MLLKSLSHLLFPPLCIHCQSLLSPHEKPPLCTLCQDLLELLDPADSKPPNFFPLKKATPLYSSLGPASALLRHLSSNAPSAPTLIASLILLGLEQRGFPWPDLIIPLPIHPIAKLFGDPHPMNEVARELAGITSIPARQALKRKLDGLGLKGAVPEKRVLLLGSSSKELPLLQEGAAVLLDHGVFEVFALTFLDA